MIPVEREPKLIHNYDGSSLIQISIRSALHYYDSSKSLRSDTANLNLKLIFDNNTDVKIEK